jgi:GNAT-family acetyltransferase (TIGR03103 family)
MEKNYGLRGRLDRISVPSVRNWQKVSGPEIDKMKSNAAIDMGWGRIIFGHTFSSNEVLYQTIMQEKKDKRDITFYLRDPHVLLSFGPDQLFLDPSHTYRLWAHDYRPNKELNRSFQTRRVSTIEDAEIVNNIYSSRKMVTCDPEFMLNCHATLERTYLVAESVQSNQIIGTVTGVDHVEAFNDPENGASLWTLAVDPKTNAPGVGEALVRHLVEHYFTRSRNYVDLSVMHDNTEAIRLYEKLGFQRVPVFCIKRKNIINEPLFMASMPEANMNPYAKIIINEARRRGISVEIIDEEYGYFKLMTGGRSVICRESLTELSSAIAMSRCDDKRLTHRVLSASRLNVPKQFTNVEPEDAGKIIKESDRLVVKPARGEQGNGISVDVRNSEELRDAIIHAKKYCDDVIVEEYVEGQDLRIIIIDYKVVAAAVRKTPKIIGTGQHTVRELIEKYNRRRAAATGGESHVPIDRETERCLAMEKCGYDTVLPSGKEIAVRKTANLHTGGTIHDVTPQIHPELVKAAENAAKAIDIPVTGLDFIVPDISGPEYTIIEANERPGLANHEPQPTAEKFIDFLFPQSAVGY